MLVDETGSTIPLGLGFLAMVSVFSLVFLELVGIQLQTLRDKQLADLAALTAANQLRVTAVSPVANHNYFSIIKPEILAAERELKLNPTLVSVTSSDGKTIEATVCTQWESITNVRIANGGQVCATSKARALN